MKPTSERIQQIAEECGALLSIHDIAFYPDELQAFFTRAYELGWKNRGESDALAAARVQFKNIESCSSAEKHIFDMTRNLAYEAIRNNTGE